MEQSKQNKTLFDKSNYASLYFNSVSTRKIKEIVTDQSENNVPRGNK